MDRSGPEAQMGLLAAARESLSEARQLLRSATLEALEQATPHITAATGSFALLECRLREGAAVGAGFENELGEFSAELRRVSALLRAAGAYHREWTRLAAARWGQYGPGAKLPPPAARPGISLQG